MYSRGHQEDTVQDTDRRWLMCRREAKNLENAALGEHPVAVSSSSPIELPNGLRRIGA